MKNSNPHILVIEDGEDLRNTLYDLLDLYGYKVSIASNGRNGLKILTEQAPDLILCDVNMPEMNGYEVLQEINATISEKDRPLFFFLTAMVQFEDIKLGLDLGADDYISKPFENSQFMRLIEKKLKTRLQL